jgi:hypothetical protein
MTYEQMRSVDINEIDPAEVTEAGNIVIDIDLPVPKRMKSYERQTGNVYFIKVGNVLVKICHSNTCYPLMIALNVI